ncbi:galactoside-binding lectin [Teladorsagia circumcincta]|uniref:Galectin n=1 Tax=Teladorsagia circumcincta TaxID=45464 RepID=A0A2G9UIG5_TELCI|nr:galactoside-binding lectin [Teladorsagia circumcincta]
MPRGKSHVHDAPIPVPYTSKLGQPLMPGQTLDVHGAINSDATRVEVNLLHGASQIDPGEAVLHINLRFDEGKIVMNTYMGGAWGKEERESMPFKKGEAFDLRVRVHVDFMEISCNGVKVHEYKHRMPFDQIEYLQIKGDCTLSGVHWGGRFYQVPWETAFPDGHLKAGQKIALYGIPKGDRWSLDLLGKGGDILFHFNPRFKDKAIFVNNEQIGTFAHRTDDPVHDYIGMRIDGEIEVTNIEFN